MVVGSCLVGGWSAVVTSGGEEERGKKKIKTKKKRRKKKPQQCKSLKTLRYKSLEESSRSNLNER